MQAPAHTCTQRFGQNTTVNRVQQSLLTSFANTAQHCSCEGTQSHSNSILACFSLCHDESMDREKEFSTPEKWHGSRMLHFLSVRIRLLCLPIELMMPYTFISQPITMITVRIFRASMTQLHPQPQRLILWITFPVNTDSTRWPFPLLWTNQTFVLWWEMKKIPSALVIWLITDRKLGVLSLSERKPRPREGLLIEVTPHGYVCRLNACLPRFWLWPWRCLWE